MPEVLEYRDVARDEWIDYNGHLSEPFYVMVFGLATTHMMDAVGVDERYRRETDSSLYTVEAHVRYLREVKAGARLLVTTSVVSVGTKKVHFCHEMYVGDTLVATEELLALHVHGDSSAPIPAEIGARLRNHLGAPPDYAGRAIHG